MLTLCVLTNTNDEALRVVGLLKKERFKANDGFNFNDLVEFRCFFKIINQEAKSPVISDEMLDAAKNYLKQAYYKANAWILVLILLKYLSESQNLRNLYKLSCHAAAQTTIENSRSFN